MHTAALIVGLWGALVASAAPSSAVETGTEGSVERPIVVENDATIDDGSLAILSHFRGSDSEAEETRSVARITLGRAERKLGAGSARCRSDQHAASFALQHRLPPASTTREQRERLTLFCIWVV